MNQHISVAALVAAGQAIPADGPTIVQILETIARAYERKPDTIYPAVRDVEFKAEDVVNAIRIFGTALQPAVDTLNAMNVPTQPTVGSVRRSLGNLTKDDIHELACECKGVEVSGQTMAKRFRELAARKV